LGGVRPGRPATSPDAVARRPSQSSFAGQRCTSFNSVELQAQGRDAT
jgi:hypothetical protein